MIKIEDIIETGKELGVFKSGIGYKRYCKNQLFPNEDFSNKSILEIGAGNGIFSLWAALNGAQKVIALEPTAEGAHNNSVLIFREFLKKLNLKNVEIMEITFQEYNQIQSEKFDIIIMLNTINHLNEEMCIKLNKDAGAKTYYRNMFVRMNDMLNSNGKIIFTDCSNTSFWTDIKMANPFAKTIEWFKHQPPKVWIKLMEESGFIEPKVTWTYHPRLPRGIFNNRICAYYYDNLFRLEMLKK